MHYRYAVGLYSVHNELNKDMWGTLRALKKMGFEGVEFYGEFAWTAQEVKAALDDTGLVCCGWHTGWNYLSHTNLLSVISYNKVLGNTNLIVPGLPDDMTNSKAAWLKTADKFNKIAEVLDGYGMCLGYHNHSNDFKFMEGDLPFHHFFDNTINKVIMQLDNGNAWSADPDTDIYDPLTRYPNRAKTLHLKPYSKSKGFATMIGEDDIDWPKFFELCREHQRVDWYIVEYECETLYNQLEGVKLCLQALKKMEGEGEI
jgi:sugar phosphate isomerase/epimerase